MNKLILFSLLLITNTLTYGMKRPDIFQDNNVVDASIILLNDDLIPQITEHICINHNYQLGDVKTAIGALSCTSAFLRNYHAHKKNQQDIIRYCALYRTLDDVYVAEQLKYCNIQNEIERFTDVALNKNKQFSENDLNDSWTLSISTTVWDNHQKNSVQQPLLQVALDHSYPKKVMQIIEHAQELNFCYNNNQNPLLTIAVLRHRTNVYDDKTYHALLEIGRHLLKKGCHVNYRANDNIWTPLMGSVLCKDEELTRLLVKFAADPDLGTFNPHTQEMITAFNYEQEKGWLQRIIDEVKKSKDNQ